MRFLAIYSTLAGSIWLILHILEGKNNVQVLMVVSTLGRVKNYAKLALSMQKVPKSTYQGARKHHDLWTIRLIMQRNIFYQVKGSRSQRSKSLKKVEVSNLLKLRSVTRVTLQFSTLVELEPGNLIRPSVRQHKIWYFPTPEFSETWSEVRGA